MLEDTNSHAGSEIRYISTQKYLSNSRIVHKWVENSAGNLFKLCRRASTENPVAAFD